MTAKLGGNMENRNVGVLSCRALAERHAAALALWIPLPRSWSDGAISTAAAKPPQGKVGVVCIPAIFFTNVGLVSTATKVFKIPATVMKDDYETLNSSCSSCMRL